MKNPLLSIFTQKGWGGVLVVYVPSRLGVELPGLETRGSGLRRPVVQAYYRLVGGVG